MYVRKIYKRIFLILFMTLFFNVERCYAQGKYISGEFSKTEDDLILDISILNTDIYGILLSFDYHDDVLKFNNCSSNNFSFTFENNKLLLEDVVGHKNLEAVSCNFQILKKNSNISFGIRDISLSNSQNVLYEDDVVYNYEYIPEEIEDNDEGFDNPSDEEGNITSNPVTSGKKIILFVVICFVLLFVICFIVYKYKMFTFIIFFLFISFPYYVLANNDINDELINKIRNILLNDTDNFDNKYDFDDDNKITINDLIISLIDFENIKNDENNDNEDNGDNEDFQISNQIKPTGKENIIYNDDTDTLKIWLEKVERNERTSFYVTHIWAKDPYNQFKSQVSDNYGNELVTADNLLKNAINQNKLDNKLVVAVNASGFVLNGIWGNSYYNVNPKYNKTATCPLVISNGKVIRDISGESMPSSISTVYDLNKNGELVYYNYPAGDKFDENIAISKKIKDDGILNTFTFRPVLVYNGELKSNTDTPSIRQGFCQIDKNNFVFITDKYSEPRTGFSYKELGEYMIGLGCKTGFNLDGGGSASLIYKKRDDSQKIITSTNREITDIIYFHE